MLSHIRTVLLHRAHERLSPSNEEREAVTTSGTVALDELTINSDNRHLGVHYAPTPRALFRWLQGLLASDDLEDTIFIDVGCGRGRIVMMAMTKPYKRVVGIEFARELCEEARANIAAFPPQRLRARDVEIIHDDAAALVVPAEPCVFFLFNPFGAEVLGDFLDNVLGSYAQKPRPMTFFYVNPHHAPMFENRDQLVEQNLPAALRARIALLSPYKVRMYQTHESGF